MNWKLIRIIDRYLGILLLFAITWWRHLNKNNMRRSQEGVRSILLVKFWGIGNLVMLLPSLRALKEVYPAGRFHLLTLAGNREALEVVGEFERIITIETGSFGSFVASCRRAVSDLKDNHYDVVIDFEQFARFSVLISSLIEAEEVIGFRTMGQHRHHLLSTSVPYDNSTHTVRSFYALAQRAGAAGPFSPETDLRVLPELLVRGRSILAQTGVQPDEPVILMHGGTSENFSERRWPPHRYAALANLLIARQKARIIFSGLREETVLIRDIVERIDQREAVIDVSGVLSFHDYFSLISVADLVISADTSAVHLASAVNVPVIGLYGPNTPLLYGPWGRCGYAIYEQLDCSPCITNFNAKIHTCRHPDGRGACMNAIGADWVYDVIREFYLDDSAPCRLKKTGATG